MVDVIEILHRRSHVFKAKDPNAAIKLCVVCNHGKDHKSLIHYGAPPSVNFGGAGRKQGAIQGITEAWQRLLAERLDTSGLDRGLQRVVVEAEIGFDTWAERDEGNFRYFIEKALGDALTTGFWELRPTPKVDAEQERRMMERLPLLVTKKSRAKGKTKVQVIRGGWLKSDCFYPTNRYSFGHIVPVPTPGQSHIRLTLFPSLEATTVDRGDQVRMAV